MSAYATPTNNGAGPQRGSRMSMSRRRVLSESMATIASINVPPLTLLADMTELSLSDLDRSNASSPVNFDSIRRHFRSHYRRTPDAASFLTPLTPEHPSTSAAHFSDPAHATPHSPTDSHSTTSPLPSPPPPPPPPKLAVIAETEQTHETLKKPKFKRLFSSVSSRLDPKKLSRRRPSETSMESERTLVPHEYPAIDIQRPLSLMVDPETQRFTGLEAWDTLFPHETRDPFAGQDASGHNLAVRVGQILEGIASRAKSRMPKAFKFMITPTKAVSPVEGRPLNISSPSHFVHKLAVTEDPQTGRLNGLPEEWQPPPALTDGYSSVSSFEAPPFHPSRGDCIPSSQKGESQSTSSSTDSPRATQAASPPASSSSVAPPSRRRKTQSFSGSMDDVRAAYGAYAQPNAQRKQATVSEDTSSDCQRRLPDKESSHDNGIHPLEYRRLFPPAHETPLPPRRTSTSRTARPPVFAQQIPAEPQVRTSETPCSRRQPPPSQTATFGPARYVVRSPRGAYGYL